MAFKTIMHGAAASWVSDSGDVDVMDAGAEYGDDSDDVDDEDVEGKSELSGDQMILVKTAIQTLSDLLEVVQAEYKVADMEDEEADEEPVEDDEDMLEDDEEEDEGDDEDDSYSSLSEAVDDIAGDTDAHEALSAAAKGIDDAVANDDADMLETSVNEFLDAVEQGLGGEDDEALQSLSEIVADMIEQIDDLDVSDAGDEEDMEAEEAPPSDEPPSEDTMDKKSDEPDDVEAKVLTVEEVITETEDGAAIIDTEEMKSLLASMRDS